MKFGSSGKSLSSFDMLNLAGTLHHYNNDLNMIENMKAKDHLAFYGREKANETMFYLSAIVNQVLEKEDRVITIAARY